MKHIIWVRKLFFYFNLNGSILKCINYHYVQITVLLFFNQISFLSLKCNSFKLKNQMHSGWPNFFSSTALKCSVKCIFITLFFLFRFSLKCFLLNYSASGSEFIGKGRQIFGECETCRLFSVYNP